MKSVCNRAQGMMHIVHTTVHVAYNGCHIATSGQDYSQVLKTKETG